MQLLIASSRLQHAAHSITVDDCLSTFFVFRLQSTCRRRVCTTVCQRTSRRRSPSPSSPPSRCIRGPPTPTWTPASVPGLQTSEQAVSGSHVQSPDPNCDEKCKQAPGAMLPMPAVIKAASKRRLSVSAGSLCCACSPSWPTQAPQLAALGHLFCAEWHPQPSTLQSFEGKRPHTVLRRNRLSPSVA